MIILETGSIFDNDEVETLVNPVNCVGAMGKGLALEFKKRWPVMYEDYAVRCSRRQRLSRQVTLDAHDRPRRRQRGFWMFPGQCIVLTDAATAEKIVQGVPIPPARPETTFLRSEAKVFTTEEASAFITDAGPGSAWVLYLASATSDVYHVFNENSRKYVKGAGPRRALPAEVFLASVKEAAEIYRRNANNPHVYSATNAPVQPGFRMPKAEWDAMFTPHEHGVIIPVEVYDSAADAREVLVAAGEKPVPTLSEAVREELERIKGHATGQPTFQEGPSFVTKPADRIVKWMKEFAGETLKMADTPPTIRGKQLDGIIFDDTYAFDVESNPEGLEGSTEECKSMADWASTDDLIPDTGNAPLTGAEMTAENQKGQALVDKISEELKRSMEEYMGKPLTAERRAALEAELLAQVRAAYPDKDWVVESDPTRPDMIDVYELAPETEGKPLEEQVMYFTPEKPADYVDAPVVDKLHVTSDPVEIAALEEAAGPAREISPEFLDQAFDGPSKPTAGAETLRQVYKTVRFQKATIVDNGDGTATVSGTLDKNVDAITGADWGGSKVEAEPDQYFCGESRKSGWPRKEIYYCTHTDKGAHYMTNVNDASDMRVVADQAIGRTWFAAEDKGAHW
jgi:hypothetical protein